MKTARIKRHGLFACIAVSIVAGFYFAEIERFSRAHFIGISTAYASLAFFVAALIIGPLNVIRSKAIPISSYLRRDLGIWSAILALVHTVAGLLVHLVPPVDRIWYYFIYPDHETSILPIRYDLFGLSNHLGLICALLMLVLLLLSNNLALRKLGAAKWKKWQRSVYFLGFALPLHGLAYQFAENRIGVLTLLLGLLVMMLVSLQVAGISKFRSSQSN